jgi:uncharacterized protein (DUF849 family)
MSSADLAISGIAVANLGDAIDSVAFCGARPMHLHARGLKCSRHLQRPRHLIKLQQLQARSRLAAILNQPTTLWHRLRLCNIQNVLPCSENPGTLMEEQGLLSPDLSKGRGHAIQ